MDKVIRNIFCAIGTFFIVVFVVVGVAGWVMNIMQIFKYGPVDGMLIAKAIGVFIAPLGAILGWI